MHCVTLVSSRHGVLPHACLLHHWQRSKCSSCSVLCTVFSRTSSQKGPHYWSSTANAHGHTIISKVCALTVATRLFKFVVPGLLRGGNGVQEMEDVIHDAAEDHQSTNLTCSALLSCLAKAHNGVDDQETLELFVARAFGSDWKQHPHRTLPIGTIIRCVYIFTSSSEG